MIRGTVVSFCAKEVNGMRSRSYSASYSQARSYKWVVGVIFILAALYMYFITFQRQKAPPLQGRG